MKKLMVLLMMAAFSVQSFGAVLVYKVSKTFNGYQFSWKSQSFVKDINGTPDPNDANAAPPLSGSSAKLESAKVEGLKFEGYLIMDVNIVDGNSGGISINDANSGVALVLADKIAKTYMAVCTVKDVNGNADANYGSARGTVYATTVFDKKGVVKKPEAAILDCSTYIESRGATDVNDPNKGVGTSNQHITLDWWLDTMMGRLSLVDITGSKVKHKVPKGLAGHGNCYKIKSTVSNTVSRKDPNVSVTMSSDTEVEDDLSANVTLNLDTKLTKSVNSQNLSIRSAGNYIIEQLKGRGYSRTTLQ